MMNINLRFTGYYPINSVSIPTFEGVYVVFIANYFGIYSGHSIKRIIYIGESRNVRDRINSHDRMREWQACLALGETLYVSVASTMHVDRLRAEAALINKHKPVLNVEHVNMFPYSMTRVISSGDIGLLISDFVI